MIVELRPTRKLNKMLYTLPNLGMLIVLPIPIQKE